jgi:hypothetical protein
MSGFNERPELLERFDDASSGVVRDGPYRESPSLLQLLCCSFLPGRILVDKPTVAETRVVADYRIDLDNLNLGNFRFTTLLNGSDYRVRGDGHFSLLGGLLYNLRTTTQAQERSQTRALSQTCIC